MFISLRLVFAIIGASFQRHVCILASAAVMMSNRRTGVRMLMVRRDCACMMVHLPCRILPDSRGDHHQLPGGGWLRRCVFECQLLLVDPIESQPALRNCADKRLTVVLVHCGRYDSSACCGTWGRIDLCWSVH